MLTDPQTLKTGATNSTTGGTSVVVALVTNDGLNSQYISSDNSVLLTVGHTFANGRGNNYARARRTVRVSKTGNVTDPITGLTTQQSFSAYIVIDEPVTNANLTGVRLFSATTVKDHLAALIAELLVTGFQDALLQGQH